MNKNRQTYGTASFILILLVSIWIAVFVNSSDTKNSNTITHVNYYEDFELTFSIQDLIHLSDSSFKTYQGSYFTKASQHCAYWLKIPIRTLPYKASTRILEVAYPDINLLDFYLVNNNEVIDSLKTGDYRKFNTREMDYQNFSYDLPYKTPSNTIIYIKAYTHKEVTIVPINIWTETSFQNYVIGNNFAWGIFFCFEGMMIILACIIFLLLHTAENKWYIGYLFSLSMFLFSLKGFAYQHFYPNLPELRTIDAPFWVGVLCFFALHFANTFLDIKHISIKLYTITKVIAAYILSLLILLPFFMLQGATIMKTFQTVFLFSAILAGWYLILPLGIFACIKKPIFKNFFYLIAYSSVNIGFMISYVTNLAIIEASPFTINILYISAFVEMLLFSTYLTINTFITRKNAVEIEKQLQAEREKKSKTIIAGEEFERERLSKYIYKNLTPLLSKVAHNVAQLSLTKENYKLQHQTNNQIDKACSFIRSVSHILSPRILQDEGLSAACNNMIYHLLNQFPEANITFRSNNSTRIDDFYCELILYRAAQEICLELLQKIKDATIIMMLNHNEDEIFLSFTIKEDVSNIISKKLIRRIKDWLVYNNSNLELIHKEKYGWLISITS